MGRNKERRRKVTVMLTNCTRRKLIISLAVSSLLPVGEVLRQEDAYVSTLYDARIVNFSEYVPALCLCCQRTSSASLPTLVDNTFKVPEECPGPADCGIDSTSSSLVKWTTADGWAFKDNDPYFPVAFWEGGQIGYDYWKGINTVPDYAVNESIYRETVRHFNFIHLQRRQLPFPGREVYANPDYIRDAFADSLAASDITPVIGYHLLRHKIENQFPGSLGAEPQYEIQTQKADRQNKRPIW